MIRLSPPTQPHQQITYALEGVTISLVYHYRRRDQGWRVDVLDEEGEAIRLSKKLVPGWNPLRRIVDSRMPPGVFWFSCPDDPVGRDAFDDGRATFVYFTEAEALQLLTEARAGQPVIYITED